VEEEPVAQISMEDGVPVLSEEFLQDPYVVYDLMRVQRPVTRVVTPLGVVVWLVTRYADARAALTDPRVSKNGRRLARLLDHHDVDPGRRAVLSESFAQHMLNSDPPNHTRLRRLVGTAFTARRIEALRPRIEEITSNLLNAIIGRHEVDLIEVFAFPLPITVICELLGVPDDERADFRSWSNSLLSTDASHQLESATAMTSYLVRLVEAKRADPTDDMLTALVHAADDDDRLSGTELVSMVFLLLVAGHETTVNLIVNGTFALLRHPQQLGMLRANPSLLPHAVEEFLRYEGPINIATLRHTTEAVVIGGTEIPAGQFVSVALASANRDPEHYAEPDQLDITRTRSNLAFGHGIHHCLGAPLARLEGEIAIGALLRRFPDLALATDPADLRWRASMLIRGLTTLPVRLGPPAGPR
jgi:cytochrome P450